ncbi:hypothetical protein [Deinococcus koreensis]|uniref:Secreted protein n=1 Tax=Deinococcus koreensis TaxID=2054903 RepID=A0A2K3UVY2_9DEIO|nr:hypothetical protein [Deinococcus koreensis]PNY80692.1 hypothetical protein CVO96_04325 [Deinococcus koreensis]
MPWMMVVLALTTGLSVNTAPAVKGSAASGPAFNLSQFSVCPAVVSGRVLPREPFRPGSAQMVPVPLTPVPVSSPRPCPIPLAAPLRR